MASETSGKKPDSGEARVSKAGDIVRTQVKAGTATEMQVLLGPEEGMPHFAMRRFLMGKDGGMPLHTNDVEHEQYVLSGKARIQIGPDWHEVGPGSVVYIPAGVPHQYRVIEAPFEFLCMVPNAPDQIRLVE